MITVKSITTFNRGIIIGGSFELLCPLCCYMCRRWGVDKCSLTPENKGEKLCIIHKSGEAIEEAVVEKCVLVSDETEAIFDVQMDIRTHRKKRQLMASEMKCVAWCTEMEQ